MTQKSTQQWYVMLRLVVVHDAARELVVNCEVTLRSGQLARRLELDAPETPLSELCLSLEVQVRGCMQVPIRLVGCTAHACRVASSWEFECMQVSRR